MKTILIILLVLAILGLWFLPALTKITILGAASYVKSLIVQAGLIK